jgi:hypothetical protein
MWLSDTAVKRLHSVVAIVLSLLGDVFGVVSFDQIETCSDLKEIK